MWDEEARRAVLLRDRLGVKPLYCAEAPGPRAVRIRAEERARQRLDRYYDLDYEASTVPDAGFFSGPATPLRESGRLPPGATYS